MCFVQCRNHPPLKPFIMPVIEPWWWWWYNSWRKSLSNTCQTNYVHE